MLPGIISDIQGAFVDGCQIVDSVLIAHECVDSRYRQECPGLPCKLDFENAYCLQYGGLGFSRLYDGEDGFWIETAKVDS